MKFHIVVDCLDMSPVDCSDKLQEEGIIISVTMTSLPFSHAIINDPDVRSGATNWVCGAGLTQSITNGP